MRSSVDFPRPVAAGDLGDGSRLQHQVDTGQHPPAPAAEALVHVLDDRSQALLSAIRVTTGRAVMGMTENYPDRFAEAMALDLSEAEKETVLELARIVAHGSERMYAPLSTYLAGQFVAELVRTGLPRSEALAEAVAVAKRTLDSEP
jgi:hypothetical protein